MCFLLAAISAVFRLLTIEAGQDARLHIILAKDDPTLLTATGSSYIDCQVTDGQNWAMEGTMARGGNQCLIRFSPPHDGEYTWIITNADKNTQTIVTYIQ